MLDTEMLMSKPLPDLKAKVILQSNKYWALEKKGKKKKKKCWIYLTASSAILTFISENASNPGAGIFFQEMLSSLLLRWL